MSIGYSQSTMQLGGSTNLINENNQLRLELDRLHKETQDLRQRHQKAEIQINTLLKDNQLLTNERNALSNQVKTGSFTSTTNFNDLKKQVELLLLENDRLHSTIDEKNREINSLKSKLQQQGGDSNSNIIAQLEMENRIVVLTTDNERYKALLADRNREIEALRKFKIEDSVTIDQFSTDRDGLDLKGKNRSFSIEIERLRFLCESKEKELEETKRQVQLLRNNTTPSTLEQFKQDMEKEDVQGQVQNLKQEKESWRVKAEELKIRNESLEAKLERIVEDQESLRGEIEFWKQKYNTLLIELPETQRGDPQERILKEENSQLKTLILEQNVQIANLRETCDDLDNVLADKEGMVKEYERKFGLLLGENERINKILAQKKREFDQLQAKAQQSADLQEKVAVLVLENQNIMGTCNELQRECENWKAKCLSFQEGETPTAYAARLEGRIHQLEDDKEELKGKDKENLRTIESMKQKLEYLEKRLEEKSKESFLTTGKASALEKAEERSKEFEMKLGLFVRENEVLVNELVEKEKEAELFKQEIHDLRFVEARFAELQGQIERVVQENNELGQELEERNLEVEHWRLGESLRKKESEEMSLNKASQLQLEKTEKAVKLLVEENEGLKDEVYEKDREIDVLRKRLDKASEQTVKAKELEVSLEMRTNEYNRLAEALREREEEISEWREKLEETEKRVERFEELEEQEMRLKENIRVLQDALNEKNRESQSIGMYRSEITKLKERLDSALMSKVLGNALNESLRISLDDLGEKNTELQGRFKAVKDVYLKEHKGLADKLDDLERNNQILKDELASKEEELEFYKEKHESAQRVETYMGEFEGRLKLLSNENESKATEVRQRTNEIEGLRKTATENEKELSNLRKKLIEYESIDKVTVFDLEEQRRTLRKENERLLKQNQENYREIEKLKTRTIQFEKVERKYEEAQEKLIEVSNENGRLNLVLMEKEYENGTWQDKCSTLEKKGNGKSVQLEKKIEALEAEIDRLNKMLQENERDSKLYRGIELESNQGFNEGEDQSYTLRFGGQSSIKKKNNNNRGYEGRYRSQGGGIGDNDEKTAAELAEENNRLGKELNSKVFEFENLREKYDMLQKGLADRVIELEEEVSRLHQEKEAMGSSSLRERSPERESIQIENLTQENRRLKHDNEEWREKYKTLKETSQTIIQELASQIKSFQEGGSNSLVEQQLNINVSVPREREKNSRTRGATPSLEMFQLQEKLIHAQSEREKLEKENSQLKKDDSAVLKQQRDRDNHSPYLESRRVSDLLDEKTKEIEKLKAQISGLQVVINQYKSFKERAEILENENQMLRKLGNKELQGQGGQLRLVLQGAESTNTPQHEWLIAHVLLCAEIERLHMILYEINETHQEQIEKVNVEWERLVDAYKERMGELESDNDALRLKAMETATARF